MASLNKVFLMGNLTRDPELRYTASGTPVADINIAVNQRFISRNSNERRDEVVFIGVTVWGKQAEACGEYLTKGSNIFIEGRLHLDTWESKDGQKRNRIRVIAQRVQFLGRPRTAVAGKVKEVQHEGVPHEAPADISVEEEPDAGEDVPSDEKDEQTPF